MDRERLGQLLLEGQGSNGFWYVATPYSRFAGGLASAHVEAAKVGAELCKRGVNVFVPIVHTHPFAMYGGINPLDHGIWMARDRPFMQAACGLVVAKMAGWQRSQGIQEEIDFFEAAERPVFYMEWD